MQTKTHTLNKLNECDREYFQSITHLLVIGEEQGEDFFYQHSTEGYDWDIDWIRMC